MQQEWEVVTEMACGKEMVVTRVELVEKGIAIEGRFALPPLVKLSIEDQVFMAAFVGVHGSIKEMERLFGISYPTVKARLKKISKQLKQLGFLFQEAEKSDAAILDRLAGREITVEEAIEGLKQCSH